MARSASRSAFIPGSTAPLTHHVAPERWDRPFDPEMTEVDVATLLAHPLFARVRPERFPASIPLRGILKNDARIRNFQPNEVVVRQGDYGNSAFVVLEGEARVLLNEPPAERLGRRRQVRPSLWAGFRRWLRRPHFPEQVTQAGAASLGAGGRGEIRIFLQDFPGVLDPDRTLRLRAGEVFGEIAALGRTPRTATVVAFGPTRLLELRWQGLREIRNYSPEWKEEIDRLYRERSLAAHLRESPLLRGLSDQALRHIADATQFETYGAFDWHSSYHRSRASGERESLESEPLIARQGDLPGGLLLIRSGFARVSTRYNHGERTESYLGKGELFGLREIVSGWRGAAVPLRQSLRALGYVDILFIPKEVIEEHLLPRLDRAELERLRFPPEADRDPGAPATDGFLEFLVAQRFINGRATMLIDLDRCTRCDDCVRACAGTHDNNPRFIRQGPEAEGVMVASACLHCADPVCMIGCPTGAIHRAGSGGEVSINPDTCIGCSVCAQSCPYGTIQMVELRDDAGMPIVADDTGLPIRRATKCDLCLELPGGPACVAACPHDALVRTDMRDRAGLAAWLHR